jgi:hypothetical protein
MASIQHPEPAARKPLVFRYVGRDAAQRPLIQVGEGDQLVVFSPSGEGVGWLLKAVQSAPVGVPITSRSADAGRKMVARGVRELECQCPALAGEIRRHSVLTRGAAVYRPSLSSPPIVTE